MLSHLSGRFQAHSLTPSATNRGLKVKQVVVSKYGDPCVRNYIRFCACHIAMSNLPQL